jgi:hypothetical protein
MWGQLALTLLQQSHLCPLPLVQQPIFWQYDHALHLYPLPHAVIIGDSSPQAQYEHGGCTVINPVSGSMAVNLSGLSNMATLSRLRKHVGMHRATHHACI